MKYLKILVFLFILSQLNIEQLQAQGPSAILNLESTEEGFLPPRMTTFDRDNITTPADGMIIFNTSTGFVNYYDVFLGWLALFPNTEQVARTQTLILGPSAFNPSRSTDNYWSGFGAGSVYIVSPATALLQAPLNLPVGTIITNVTFYYKDNDNAGEITFRLDRENVTMGSFSFIATHPTGVSYATDTWESHTVTVNHTVTTNYGYYVGAYSMDWDNLGKFVKGVEISYILPFD